MCYLTFHLIRVLLRKNSLPLKGKAFWFVRDFLICANITAGASPCPTMLILFCAEILVCAKNGRAQKPSPTVFVRIFLICTKMAAGDDNNI